MLNLCLLVFHQFKVSRFRLSVLGSKDMIAPRGPVPQIANHIFNSSLPLKFLPLSLNQACIKLLMHSFGFIDILSFIHNKFECFRRTSIYILQMPLENKSLINIMLIFRRPILLRNICKIRYVPRGLLPILLHPFILGH